MKHKRIFLFLVAVFSACVFSSSAFALLWSWGYNYQSSTSNTSIASGYNYWVAGYYDIRSGAYWQFGWRRTDNTFCGIGYAPASVPGSGTVHPSDFGCGGYITTVAEYNAGTRSYDYVQANT